MSLIVCFTSSPQGNRFNESSCCSHATYTAQQDEKESHLDSGGRVRRTCGPIVGSEPDGRTGAQACRERAAQSALCEIAGSTQTFTAKAEGRATKRAA